MKKFSLLILSIINIIVSAIYIAMSPLDVVPLHYNILGEADEFGSKWRYLVFPIIIIVVGVGYLVRCIYAKKNNSESYDEKTEFKIFASMCVFFLAISWYMNITGLNKISDTFFTIGFGVYLLYLSNMYGKLKYKSIMGIRTKATLSDKNIWKKAHRLGGYLGVSAGIFMIILGIVFKFIEVTYFLPMFLIITILAVAMAEGIPAIYAQMIYKKENR